ncbi:MAG: DUF58 domain-containing protein, partial [bacterium]
HTSDPREYLLPNVGLVRLHDAERGTPFWIDTNDSGVRRKLRRNFEEWQAGLKRGFQKAGVDYMALPVDRPYIPALVKFFRDRERRR